MHHGERAARPPRVAHRPARARDAAGRPVQPGGALLTDIRRALLYERPEGDGARALGGRAWDAQTWSAQRDFRGQPQIRHIGRPRKIAYVIFTHGTGHDIIIIINFNISRVSIRTGTNNNNILLLLLPVFKTVTNKDDMSSSVCGENAIFLPRTPEIQY